jgi:hypothetical protein
MHRPANESQAIKIAEAELRNAGYISGDETLRSEAARYDPPDDQPRGTKSRKAGWDVIVSLVPGAPGRHWFVFVPDKGKIEIKPGA